MVIDREPIAFIRRKPVDSGKVECSGHLTAPGWQESKGLEACSTASLWLLPPCTLCFSTRNLQSAQLPPPLLILQITWLTSTFPRFNSSEFLHSTLHRFHCYPTIPEKVQRCCFGRSSAFSPSLRSPDRRPSHLSMRPGQLRSPRYSLNHTRTS